jgi:trimeric autotransporter adhesin
MSTKTTKQRIALVAVSALTVGLLTAVSTPAANAYGNITYATAGNTPAIGSMQIGLTPTTSGTIALVDGTAANLGKDSVMTSLGFIAKTSTAGTLLGTTALQLGDTVNASSVSDEVATAVVAQGAKLSVAARGVDASGEGVSLVVSGAATLSSVTGYTGGGAGTTTINGTSTTAWMNSAGTQSILAAVFNVTGAPGSTATISAYTGAAVDGTSSATNGVLIAQLTVTVAAADASGAFSASNSRIFTQAAMAKGGTASGTNAYDNTARANNGQVNVVYVLLRDAYLAPITSGTLTASVTAGTVNVVDSAGASDSYAATAAFDTISLLGSDGAGYVVVNQPVANTAGSATLTLTLDGAVIGTKTLNWNGDIASIAIDTANTAKTFNNPTTFGSNAASPAAAVKNIVYVAKDAAGNVLELAAHPTIGDQTGSMVGASLSTVDAGASATGDDSSLQTQADGYGVATMLIPSSALRGAGTYQLRITNAVGTTIKSAVQNVTVAGGANTFTASWDKATYAPGDIATLTITAKDSAGNNVGTGVALGSGSLIVTNTDGLSSVTSSCDSANIAATTYTDGVKTCKFAVKNAAGSYSWTAVVATATGQSAAVGTATVSAGTAVSNADVLKAIVSLIASINKQIAALQKALLRR